MILGPENTHSEHFRPKTASWSNLATVTSFNVHNLPTDIGKNASRCRILALKLVTVAKFMHLLPGSVQ